MKDFVSATTFLSFAAAAAASGIRGSFTKDVVNPVFAERNLAPAGSSTHAVCPIDHGYFQGNEKHIEIKEGQSSDSSYWLVDFKDGAGFVEAYCVDILGPLQNGMYNADTYSIYSGNIPAEAVDKDQGLAMSNWLLNDPFYQQGEMIPSCPHSPAITWREIQAAIWLLTDHNLPSDLGQDTCVTNALKHAASQHGDYVPACDEKLAVVIVIDDNDGAITNQVIIAIVDPPEAACQDCCACNTDEDCLPKCDPVEKVCVPMGPLECIDHDVIHKNEYKVKIKSGRGSADRSYWLVDFDPDNGNNNDFVDAWCVDYDRNLGNGVYDADLYSSYSSSIPADAVDYAVFLPAINYIVNAPDLQKDQPVQDCGGALISWSDIQLAIWNTIDDASNPRAGLSTVNHCVVNYIVRRASTKFNYEPKCDEKLAVLLVIDNDQNYIEKQVIVAVVEGPPCKECPPVGCIDHEAHRSGDEIKILVEDGRQSGASFWRVDFTPNDNVHAFAETWCVDSERTIGSGYYYADVYSSYDSDAIPDSAIDKDDFLPELNYLLNSVDLEQGTRISTCSNAAVTWREMQVAVWRLIDDTSGSGSIGNNYNNCIVQYLVAEAKKHPDYVPACDEQLAVLIVVDSNDGVIQKQVLAALVPPICEECPKEVCDEDACATVPLDQSDGIAPWGQCFKITKDILENPYGGCQEGYYCKGYSIWWASCVPIPAGYSMPVDPLGEITSYVPHDCAGSDYDTCPEAMNLGSALGASGAVYPLIAAVPQNSPNGQDDGISILVGGDFTSYVGAEAEGKVVVVGDLIIKDTGLHSLVGAGVGSGVVPSNSNGPGLIVGNDVVLWGSHTVYVNGADAVIGGEIVRHAGGELIAQPSPPNAVLTDQALNIGQYVGLIAEISVKSAYWATLYPNGVVVPALQHPSQNIVTFKAIDDDCLQVFHIEEFDFGPGTVVNVEFDATLAGKTILINVASKLHSDGKRKVTIPSWGDFVDPYGDAAFSFSSEVKASILWNFYDADHVTLGTGGGGPEFAGSIIVPNGSLDFLWPGHSGRLVVGHDLFQESTGSEFHNYDFDPPCPLPLPPCIVPPPECVAGCPCQTDDDCHPTCDLDSNVCRPAADILVSV